MPGLDAGIDWAGEGMRGVVSFRRKHDLFRPPCVNWDGKGKRVSLWDGVGFVVSHPRRKDKDAPRVGHPEGAGAMKKPKVFGIAICPSCCGFRE
jgi:hypothetical protein